MKIAIYLLVITFFPLQGLAEEQLQDKVIHIYQDADLSNHVESSESIQKGIEVAFSEIGNEIEGYKVKFKYLNHRGNVIRSQRNYQTFIDDPLALAIYSGIHSPPLIKNRRFINENKALTLVPWAAGGPITRYPSPENWVFRLSIDDTQAGSTIVNFAIKQKSCKRPHLLLEDTSWGDSNFKSMSKALLELHGINAPSVTRFGWNLQEKGARVLLLDIIRNGSDCVILVANALEGSVIVQAMLDVAKDKLLPIISHWGITGGNFHNKIDSKKRKNLDLHFIQSCFAFTNAEQSDLSKRVFKTLAQHSVGKIHQPKDLPAAVGFIHAYDLTKIFIQAVRQTGLTGDIERDRDDVRVALENLKGTIAGLTKSYDKPFSMFNPDTNFNAHEALGNEHYCMGKYGDSDEVLIVQ